MGIFCDRLKFGSIASLDVWATSNVVTKWLSHMGRHAGVDTQSGHHTVVVTQLLLSGSCLTNCQADVKLSFIAEPMGLKHFSVLFTYFSPIFP